MITVIGWIIVCLVTLWSLCSIGIGFWVFFTDDPKTGKYNFTLSVLFALAALCSPFIAAYRDVVEWREVIRK